MKKTTICLAVLLSLFLSFNAYAMKNYEHGWPDIAIPSPSKDSDFQYGYRWTWLDDDLCIQFQANEVKTAKITRECLRGKHDAGLTTCWYDENKPKSVMPIPVSGASPKMESGLSSLMIVRFLLNLPELMVCYMPLMDMASWWKDMIIGTVIRLRQTAW